MTEWLIGKFQNKLLLPLKYLSTLFPSPIYMFFFFSSFQTPRVAYSTLLHSISIPSVIDTFRFSLDLKCTINLTMLCTRKLCNNFFFSLLILLLVASNLSIHFKVFSREKIIYVFHFFLQFLFSKKKIHCDELGMNFFFSSFHHLAFEK